MSRRNKATCGATLNAQIAALALRPRALVHSSTTAAPEDEEDDDAFSAHQPSSPLSRVAPWSSSTATGPSSAGTSSHSTSSHSHYSGFGFTVGSSSSASSARRSIMKTPGRDDDDEDEEVEDDAVNPSPLFQRRRAQYKSTASSLSAATRRRISSGGTSRSPAMPRYASPTSSPPIAALFENPRATAAAGEDENPRKAFLRERFKKTYFARATKAREEAVRKRRRRVEGMEGRVGESDEEMEEEGDEAILNDVLFARIMASLNKKQERAYRISYAREVGSSFDPDLEDVSRWEQELSGAPLPPTSFSPHCASSSHHASSSHRASLHNTNINGGGSSPPRPPTEYEYDSGYGYEGYGEEGEEDFVGLEEAEIEAYAEEYARAVEGREAEAASASSSSSGSGTGAHRSSTGVQQGQDVGNLLEGLEDLPEEELFGVWNWDDGDEMDLS